MSQDPDDEIDQGPAWGWGWLSDAAKAAKSAYDANVKPALDSMEATTSQFGTFIITPISAGVGMLNFAKAPY